MKGFFLFTFATEYFMNLIEQFKKSPSWLLYGLAFLFILRLAFTLQMGLMPQDAYYYLYSENLALSYFDHPPMIAYFLGITSFLFGKSEFVIKLTDLFASLLTIFVFYQLSSQFLPTKKAFRSLILLFSTLLMSILSLISTPDVPLLLFWTISLLLLNKAIFEEKNLYWIGAGISMGLAMDSKYTAVALPLGMLLFLIINNHQRRKLLSIWPWLTITFCIATFLPVILWNIQNDFASFRFQSSSRMNSIDGFQAHFKYLLGVIGHQSAIVLPLIFFTLLYLLLKYLRKYQIRISQISQENQFLLCFFLPIFLGFLGISLIYWVKINWMMPAYITGIIWLSKYINSRFVKWHLGTSVIVHILFSIEVLYYLVPVKSDDTWFGWKEFSDEVLKINTQYPDAFIFSADDYKTTAILNFYLNKKVYGRNIIGQAALQYNIIDNNLDHLKKKDALFIDSEPRLKIEDNQQAPEILKNYFDSITVLQPIQIKNQDKVVRKFNVYLCRNYK